MKYFFCLLVAVSMARGADAQDVERPASFLQQAELRAGERSVNAEYGHLQLPQPAGRALLLLRRLGGQRADPVPGFVEPRGELGGFGGNWVITRCASEINKNSSDSL